MENVIIKYGTLFLFTGTPLVLPSEAVEKWFYCEVYSTIIMEMDLFIIVSKKCEYYY